MLCSIYIYISNDNGKEKLIEKFTDSHRSLHLWLVLWAWEGNEAIMNMTPLPIVDWQVMYCTSKTQGEIISWESTLTHKQSLAAVILFLLIVL